MKQSLTKYHPNAIRNRLPVVFKDAAIPGRRFCYPRNVHQKYELPQQPGFNRFRTTSQNFYNYDTKALSVGESNQGIVSEKSKWIHQAQTS